MTKSSFPVLASDVNPGKDTTEQFQTLNRAYEVLSNPSLKKNYDMFGDRGIGTSAQSDIDVGERMNRRGQRGPDLRDMWAENGFFDGFGRGPHAGFHGPVDFEPFPGGRGSWDAPGPEADFSRWGGVSGKGATSRQRRSPHVPEENMDFDWFGGSGRGDNSKHRPYGPIIGDDIAIDFAIDFKTAVLGGLVEVKLNRIEQCSTCEGTGAQADTKRATCQTCGGSGVSIPVNSRSGPVFSIACPDCQGRGETILNPCSACDGSAVAQKAATVKVEIPAGVTTGSRVRVQGEGDVGPLAGPAGDLFLFLKIKEDPIFRRDGSDIHSDVTISCFDAIVGTSVTVPVIDGEAAIEIPPGTQPGHVICIKRRGAASLISDQRGDHFVTVDIKIPNAKEDKDNQLVQLIANSASARKYGVSQSVNGAVPGAINNFSVSFPPSTPKKEEDKTTSSTPKPVTTNASVPFPTSAPCTSVAQPHVASGASSTSTIIDNQTLADLKDQAALAEDEKRRRIKFEELAAQRERDLEAQALKLKELESQALMEREERARIQEVAVQRERELEEHVRRQNEMNREITIRVRQNTGQTTRITLKKSTEMAKMFEMVARQKGIRASDLQFSFQGRALGPEDTPLDLCMDTNSMIDLAIKRTATGGGVGVGVRF
jgi:molecular chaperone DnaJ